MKPAIMRLVLLEQDLEPVHQRQVVGKAAYSSIVRMRAGVDEARQDHLTLGIDGCRARGRRATAAAGFDRHADVAAVDGRALESTRSAASMVMTVALVTRCSAHLVARPAVPASTAADQERIVPETP